MLNTVVSLLDKVVALLQARQEHRRNFFDRVVSPVYNNMLLIHDDYRQTLDTLLQLADEGEMLDALRGQRALLQPLRDHVISMCFICRNECFSRRSPQYLDFFAARRRYFMVFSDRDSPQTSQGSRESHSPYCDTIEFVLLRGSVNT